MKALLHRILLRAIGMQMDVLDRLGPGEPTPAQLAEFEARALSPDAEIPVQVTQARAGTVYVGQAARHHRFGCTEDGTIVIMGEGINTTVMTEPCNECTASALRSAYGGDLIRWQ